MTKYAAILFYRSILEYNKNNNSINAFIVNMVHDELVIECSKEYSKFVSELLVKCMEDAGKIFCPTVPMKVDPIISNKWQK